MSFKLVLVVVVLSFAAFCEVDAGFTRYGSGYAGFGGYGGIFGSGHSTGFNTFGTNVYYGSGVGGAYPSRSHYG